ncbi:MULTISPECIES: acyl carrier protein [unclassified Streptomyces]|uniref:acyl carrier protein n=1 Tax=unclassified Streptomyces TaxID=2593676 RepID=UPI0004BEEDC2|nr:MULTISPECIES: acyl carrier protein [unclassified Streptomyces]
MRDEIREFVLTTIREVMNLPLPEDLTDDTPLGEGGLGLESLSRLELMIQLESAYGIEVPEADSDAQENATLGEFVDAVAALRGAAVADGAGR